MNLKIININRKVALLMFAVVLLASSELDAQTTVLSNSFQNTISVNNTQSHVLPAFTCIDLSYDLFQGLSDKPNDKSVTNLQKYLNNLGYLKANPNGYFGPATMSAVKTYQTANHISNTGRVGPATRKSIRERSCNVSNTASVINSINNPTPTPSSKSLEIDSLNPGTIYANQNSSVALIGRGFDSSTFINFDVNNREIKFKPSFISSDGKVLVFLVPNYLSGGQYSIAVYNTYSSGATSTPSNAVSLIIK